jgi:transposase
LFVLYAGIPWEFLPQELGFGSGMTCWRRLRDWHEAGVWQQLHEALLAELHEARALDWSRAVIGSSHVRAMKGGPKPGPSPVDRARTGSKHHLISEAHGIPLAVSLTSGHRNDITQPMPLIQAIPPVRGRRGRPRQRPDALYADRGYDRDKYRRQVRSKGVTPVIARRRTDHGSGLGTYRWAIGQSVTLLHRFRRLRIRWEIRDDIHEAFLSLACAIICWRRLRNLSLCYELLLA